MSKKYHQVKVNIPIEEWEQLEPILKKEKMSGAAYLRKCAGIEVADNNRVSSRGGKKKIVSAGSFSVIWHLAKIGTNLNQIARRCNVEKKVDRHTLFALAKLYNEIWSVPDVSEN